MSEAVKTIDELRSELGSKLKRPEQISASAGVSTGHQNLDEFLLWKGYPKGEISLISGTPGLGATTLLSQCALQTTKSRQWAEWNDHNQYTLCPWVLHQQGCDFSKLLLISSPDTEKKLIWTVSELCSLSLFEVIICNVSHLTLKRHHLVKLKQVSKRYQVALVFKNERPQPFLQSFYAFAGHFQSRFFEIQRAQHRQTPKRMERRAIYENFMPQLTEAREAFRRRELPRLQPEGSFS